jgi:dihydrofolate reductase
MRRIVASVFVSLDGVMQAPGGPEEDPTGGFRYGGWTTTYWDDTTGAVMEELFSAPFDLLLGRRTYDIFAAYWPYRETDRTASDFEKLNADIATAFNRVVKYVATHSPDTLSWQNSRWLGKDVVTSLRDLKKEDGPVLLIQGSSALVQQLLAADLIDEVRMLIFPLVLGRGKRFFGEGTTPAALKPLKSTVSRNGVIIASYERAGEIRTGSFGAETPSAAEIERRAKLR